MLRKEEIRGIVISLVILIMMLAMFYLITILTRNSWMEMGNDISKRAVEIGKQLAIKAIEYIAEKLRI